MAIKELVTRFGFEIDDKGLKELQDGIDAVKEGILHLGEALIGEAVGLYELVHHAYEAGLQLKLMTQETGLAAEKLQELQFRAKLAEVSADELNQSMGFLARNMEQARTGSDEARKHFRQFGITIAELRSGTLTTDQVLNRVAKTFQNLPDGPRKTGIAMELFGRSGRRMVPFLNSLTTALDPVNEKILQMSMITEGQIEQAENFHIGLETLKTAFLGITRVIGFGLMPVATEIIETMKKWVVENRKLVIQNLTEFVKGMAAALKLTLKISDALIQSFVGLAHSIGGVEVATELLLGTFAVLSGATVLFGIGKVIEAVVTLGNSFAVANLKAAALPIGIGAALVGLLLIMEDIYSFFNGKDSFTGDLLKKLPEVGNYVKAIFEPIFAPLVALITHITDGAVSWKVIFKDVGELIVNVILLPLRLIFSTISAVSGVAGKILNSKGLQDFSDLQNKIAQNTTAQGIGQIFSSEGSSPQTAASSLPSSITPQAALGSSTSNTKQVQNNVDMKNEFNFPPGTNPETVGDKIVSSMKNGIDDILRATNRSTNDAGAY